MSTDLKLSKVQISKIIQSGGFLGSLLSTLAGLLMKVAIALAKNILAAIGIKAAAAAIDAGIQNKIHGLTPSEYLSIRYPQSYLKPLKRKSRIT